MKAVSLFTGVGGFRSRIRAGGRGDGATGRTRPALHQGSRAALAAHEEGWRCARCCSGVIAGGMSG